MEERNEIRIISEDKNIWDNYNYVDYIDYRNMEIRDLPVGMNIATMSCTVNLNIVINKNNIMNGMKLNDHDVLSLKLDKNLKTKLTPKKKKKKDELKENNKKRNNHFYNQITLDIRVSNGDIMDETGDKYVMDDKSGKINIYNNLRKINIKIFGNGAIELSGCRKIEDVNIVINKLVHRLLENDTYIEDGEIDVTNFKINMIMANYKVKYMINRLHLKEILDKKNMYGVFEKLLSSKVTIKINPLNCEDKKKFISMFVFEKGSILITGSTRSKEDLEHAYNFLNNIFIEHGDYIFKKPETSEIKILQNLHRDVLNENSHKLEEIRYRGFNKEKIKLLKQINC